MPRVYCKRNSLTVNAFFAVTLFHDPFSSPIPLYQKAFLREEGGPRSGGRSPRVLEIGKRMIRTLPQSPQVTAPGVSLNAKPFLSKREEAATGNGFTKPSPAGEGGSRRLTDEVF